MTIAFNPAQAKLLATFFADLAKGALLVGLGFSTVVPTLPELRFSYLTASVIFAGFCLRVSLELLKEVSDD